jgi:hypothetical protein
MLRISLTSNLLISSHKKGSGCFAARSPLFVPLPKKYTPIHEGISYTKFSAEFAKNFLNATLTPPHVHSLHLFSINLKTSFKNDCSPVYWI